MTATATDAFGETATHRITIEVVNRPPQPQIIRPLATDTLHSHIPVQLTAYVPDPDESIPDANVSWSSDLDGPLGTGWQVTHQLTTGTHTLTVTAVDAKGLIAQDQVTVNVTPGEGLPLPQITSPGDNLFIGPDTLVTLQGTASDPEDGTLNGASLEWRSSIDGLLGTGSSVQVVLSGPQVRCNPESVDHTISFTARDSDGHEVTVQLTITVGLIC